MRKSILIYTVFILFSLSSTSQSIIYFDFGEGGNVGGLTEPYNKPDPYFTIPIHAQLERYKEVSHRYAKSIFIKGHLGLGSKSGQGYQTSSQALYFGVKRYLIIDETTTWKGKVRKFFVNPSIAYGLESVRWEETRGWEGEDKFKLLQVGLGIGTYCERKRINTRLTYSFHKDIILDVDRYGDYEEGVKKLGAFSGEWRLGFGFRFGNKE